MKLLAILLLVLMSGCASDPELYDGRSHVVIYCNNAGEHIHYLKSQLASSKDPEFINSTKNLIWNIKFSCK